MKLQVDRFLSSSSISILAVLGILASASAIAGPSGYRPGSSLTSGAVTNHYALSSLAYNPASAFLVLRPDENLRFGWLSTFGMSTEFGDVANFEDELNRLADILDRDDLSLTEAADIVDSFNAVLPILGRDGYVKLSSGVALPLMPAVFTMVGMPGHFFIDAASEMQVGASFIDAPVSVQILGSTGSVSTQSSLYLKSGTDLRLGVGYAQPVWAGGDEWFGGGGQLIVGGKMDYHRVSLSKQVILIDDVDDFGDTITNDYNSNKFTSNGVALSFGTIWRADQYQLGFTLYNINEPKFEYGTVGRNCDTLSGTSQNNCFQAQAFAADGRIDSTETHTMHAYSTLDASFWATPHLMVGTSFDLSKREDFVGDDIKLLTMSVMYQSDYWAIPGVRAGYRQNQVGSELSSVTFGMTLFRNANLDIEYGLDSTEIDGNSAPRNFAINFGFQEQF